jgi:tRNA threonylcarbamoyladenosine biosynthesis protein TsaE
MIQVVRKAVVQGVNRHYGSLNNMEASFDLATEADTLVLAEFLAASLKAPLVLGFEGDLGAGKTYLIRGILRALGVVGPVKSPTFSYVESYHFSEYTLHHFDLYRISGSATLDVFREYFSPDTICCIEWPARAPRLMPYLDVLFALRVQGEGRRLSMTASTSSGKNLLEALRRTLT